MKDEGFTLKTGKWIWKHDEEELLKQTLIGICNGSIPVTIHKTHIALFPITSSMGKYQKRM